MIPRYQRVLFWILAVASLLMALVLLRGCEQTREKLMRHRNQTPLAAPVATENAPVRLALANDADGSITLVEREVALPAEATARARTLLTRLISEYGDKDSGHPIESGPAVDDVFLLDLPLRPAVAPGSRSAATPQQNSSIVKGWSDPNPPSNAGGAQDMGAHNAGGKLAVINLHGSFADHHPSGIEVETLTINSIIGTLYANFPTIEQVRFLVDGQPRETLSGHADLLRTYEVFNTANKPAQGGHQ